MGRNRRVTGVIFSITPIVEKLGFFRTVQCGSTFFGWRLQDHPVLQKVGHLEL